jgi:tyrosyl-tRNA synthetase
VRSKTVHAVAYPLITRSDGTKFGKTADGESVWLDPQRTSPYRFYQFLFNIEDAKVLEMLSFYTFLSQDEIAEYQQAVAEHPEQRSAQRRLAQEVTRLVHGDSGVAKAEQAAKVLFGEEIAGLSASEIQEIFADAPSQQVAKDAFAGDGMPLVNLLVTAGVAKSNGEARRLISSGGVYLNNVRINDAAQNITLAASIDGKFLVLRKGKREYTLVQIQA